MEKNKNHSRDAADLRQKAEAAFGEQSAWSSEDLASLSPEETCRILHELQVHQIELEMQNEELRTAQEELDASRDRYFDLYDLAPVGYITLSEQGLILETNLAAATLLGESRSNLVRRPLSGFILTEDQDIYYRHRKQLFESGEPQEGDLRMVKKGGVTAWVHITATAAQYDSGPVCRIVMINITERKQAEAEQEKLQAQLNQAQKMESVGRLAGGVAHDFNNMLGVILGYTELAMNQVDSSLPLHADLEEIQKAARRSADLTRQLLTFARKQVITPRVLDLNDIVPGMIKMLRRLIGENIDLFWISGENLWPVQMDPSQIDQILANLCVNAKDAIAGIGKITLKTGNCVLDESWFAVHPDFMPGNHVRLTVSDNGCGMDKETLAHLFEPFFTTKEVGEGTGLGLATVYGIVKQNKGFINVYSEPGQGTIFNIYLPRHLAGADSLPAKDLVQPTLHGNETILVVEDEPAIMKLTVIILQRLGYTVIGAGSPNEGIRLAGSHPGHIHLLITDVIMPEMNGQDLAKTLLSRYPGLKCLFMSGYTADIITRQGILDKGVHFIQKPFSMTDLSDKVRAVLDDIDAIC